MMFKKQYKIEEQVIIIYLCSQINFVHRWPSQLCIIWHVTHIITLLHIIHFF